MRSKIELGFSYTESDAIALSHPENYWFHPNVGGFARNYILSVDQEFIYPNLTLDR